MGRSSAAPVHGYEDGFILRVFNTSGFAVGVSLGGVDSSVKAAQQRRTPY
jgi:hypothetical protein